MATPHGFDVALDRDAPFCGDLFYCKMPGCGGVLIYHTIAGDLVRLRGYREDCPCCGDLLREDEVDAVVAREAG